MTLSYSFWDWHGNNFQNARQNLPDLDQAVSALVDDLYERGLDQDVTVIVWGEFGRTPRINKDAGRDHWPNVSCALLAGGGMRVGQAIGTTDRYGGEAKDRPVHFQEIFATLYHNLGIDPHNVTVTDLTGRPRYLVDATTTRCPNWSERAWLNQRQPCRAGQGHQQADQAHQREDHGKRLAAIRLPSYRSSA